MEKKRFYKTELLKLGLQLFLYASLFLCFYLCMAINNIALAGISRTSVITVVTYTVMLILLSAVYGGFDIGMRSKRSVFASLLLTTGFSDVISYIVLQIMNVNPRNPQANARLELISEDLALLVGAFVLQFALIYFFISIGFRLYWRINPAMDCCIITSSQEAADHVAQKIASFHRRFHLTEVVHYGVDDLHETILNHDVIFLTEMPDTEKADIECFCYQHRRSVYLTAELEDVIVSTAEQQVLDDAPFMAIHRVEMTLMQRIVKRASDIVISFLGLLILSPILLVTAAVLKAKGNGSVIFKQQRATIDGKVFEIYKFRTMYESIDNYSATQNDDRITPVGQMLRRYRIDELPQLWNVLKGDMSMVGPRPEMLENVERYVREVPEFRYRQQMKAGLTGLAQIEGKYNTTPKDKAMLDLLYIERFSLGNDVKLMLRTFTVFFRHDSTEGFGERKVYCPQMRTLPNHQ